MASGLGADPALVLVVVLVVVESLALSPSEFDDEDDDDNDDDWEPQDRGPVSRRAIVEQADTREWH